MPIIWDQDTYVAKGKIDGSPVAVVRGLSHYVTDADTALGLGETLRFAIVGGAGGRGRNAIGHPR